MIDHNKFLIFCWHSTLFILFIVVDDMFDYLFNSMDIKLFFFSVFVQFLSQVGYLCLVGYYLRIW